MKKIIFWVCLFPILWTACNNTATPRKESGEWARVPEILKKIVPPTFPDSIYDVTAYGAKSDTTFDSRPAILEAVNQCNQNGVALYSFLPETISAKVPSFCKVT